MPQASASDIHPILGISWQKMPRHMAIIMDGNGRWAQNRGRPRIEGHRNGYEAVRSTITESARIGVECLTLYSFSTENWKRPAEEVRGLMDLYAHYLITERVTIMNNNIKMRHLGERENLPSHVLDELDKTVEMSRKNTGMTLCLALNYSGRSELVGAIKKTAQDVKAGTLVIDQIDEAAVSKRLDTVDLPDPDLLIRTAGERRISNFLLWQISYAELYITEVLWPDVNRDILFEAIREYANRDRRFGGLNRCEFTTQ